MLGWPSEDGGPDRRQWTPGSTLDLRDGESLEVTSRSMMVATMVVVSPEGDVYALCHTGGDDAVSWVEALDPISLETRASSPQLPGGPAWPGGMALHANGDIHVVFGRHAHRLSKGLEVRASTRLPRDRPYNSFVTLPSGHLVTKDFGGSRPGHEVAEPFEPCHLVVLEPDTLHVVSQIDMPEASIARLSADGDDVYVVGTSSLWRAKWTGDSLMLDDFRALYRTLPGQTFGWDAVIADGYAWFLDNGESTHRFAGTLRGVGTASAPLHLVRVSLRTGHVLLTEICGLPGGVVANPPLVDARRRMVVGFDSGNGVIAGFRYSDETLEPQWSHQQDHGCHMLLYPDSGEFVSAHHDAGRGVEQVVVRDVESGREKSRVDTGSPIQSVVFPACGTRRDFYWCSMLTISRVSVR